MHTNSEGKNKIYKINPRPGIISTRILCIKSTRQVQYIYKIVYERYKIRLIQK